MGRIYFTDEQLKDLSVNPFVKKLVIKLLLIQMNLRSIMFLNIIPGKCH
ncbi:hypothetical protein J1C67_01745 [Clostridium gasigenes]|nr:hypothetical protein [Clostridium gasigenes]QSW19951.1 hypothetical protein J1C67_01745 [Clostridium gasigenes]